MATLQRKTFFKMFIFSCHGERYVVIPITNGCRNFSFLFDTHLYLVTRQNSQKCIVQNIIITRYLNSFTKIIVPIPRIYRKMIKRESVWSAFIHL